MRKRTKEISGSGLLVIVELGGQWPGLMQADASARRVVTQQEGETPASFADRVAAGLDSLFGKGVKLGTVALACNERTDDAAESARRRLGGLALGAMAKHKAGRFCLTTSPRSSGRLRHALTVLATGLHDEWRTAGLEVTVELSDELKSAPIATATPARARVA